MAFTSNLQAMNACNATLKAAYPAGLTKEQLKEARALHFKLEKIEGEWHALIICPLPGSLASIAPAASQGAAPIEQAAISNLEVHAAICEGLNAGTADIKAAEIVADARKSHLIGASAEQALNLSQMPLDPKSGHVIDQAPDAAFFKPLDPDEAAKFRAWARANFKAGEEINPVWHPIVRAECELIEIEAGQKAADLQANIEEATSKLKGGKVWIHASSCESPVKRVWAIADSMIAKALDENQPSPSRKEVQDECIRQGVASGTARTQYQAWKKANDNDRANASNAAALSAAINGKHK